MNGVVGRLFASAVTVAGLQAAAAWPVWTWYAHRVTDGSDGPWPLAALGLFAAILVMARDGAGKPVSLVHATIMTAIYAATVLLLPPIFRCAAAFSAVGSTLVRWRLGPGGHWPFVALLVLAAPMIASLDFTLGFPLRLAASHCTAALVSLAGFSVSAEGTLLRWGSRMVAIDAPCSGARMLYTGLVVTAALAAYERFSLRRTAAAFAGAIPVTVAANVFRAAGLFFIEAGVVADAGIATATAWVHSGLGVLVFGLLTVSLLHMNRWIGTAHTFPFFPLPAATQSRIR
ncbi:MAG: archaeosortase/exosortase family protein [Bryobacteraceae bacterium]